MTLILTASDVEALLPMAAAIAAMDDAMRQVSAGETLLPLRQFMPVPAPAGQQALPAPAGQQALPGGAGKMAVMPGAVARPHVFGLKTVAKFPGAAASHVGVVQIFDGACGRLEAIIEGGSLTAIRTAAASALATRALARPDAAVLAVLGTGEQARRHIEAMAAVRTIRELRVWGRRQDAADALAADWGVRLGVPAQGCSTVADAVAGADLICTTTPAVDPILMGADVMAGAHVNLVGSAVATTAEADAALVARSEYYVDYRAAAQAAAGELKRAIEAGVVDEGHVRGEIGELLLGRVPGRSGPDSVTVYKSLGVTAQDLVAGAAVWTAAVAAGRGLRLDLSA